METCRFRLPAKAMTLAGLVASFVLAQSALAQTSRVVDPQVQPAASPGSDDSQNGQVPQITQTPQSNYPAPYSELSGSGAGAGQPLGAGAGQPLGAGDPSGMGGVSGMGGPGGMGTAPPTNPYANMGANPYANMAADFGAAGAPGSYMAGGGGSSQLAAITGYIDSAIIRSRVRVRYDDAFGLNAPDKAEFFYAKCGCFANPKNFGLSTIAPGTFTFNLAAAAAKGYDPRARGPQHLPNATGRPVDKFGGGEPLINYQEQSTYIEFAPLRNFSTFVEVPVRFLNPTLVQNHYGFGDVNAGFKYAFVAEPDRYYTFQMRAYMPTGAANLGLGTGHVSFEPALLIFQRLTERLYLSGEFRDWIPVDGSNFAGNVLRYGLGLTYNAVLTENFRFAPVNEVVGWTILGGQESTAGNPVSVAGQTIVNEKIGFQIGLGQYAAPGGGSNLNDRHTFFFGYARCVTGDHWYRDNFRMEYNFWF